ncbi:MAG: KH domain-containing protein [Acidobacteriaceae bacterium]
MSSSNPLQDNKLAISEMQTLMTEITRALVDDVDAVRVESVSDQNAVVLRLHVATNDVGKIIGKQGRTARSLRTILGAASMKLQHRFSLDIVEIKPEHPNASNPDKHV